MEHGDTGQGVTAAAAADPSDFARRHIGADAVETEYMLTRIGCGDAVALIAQALPHSVRESSADAGSDLLPAACDESAMLGELREIAEQNTAHTSMIGLGYYGTVTPAVLRRGILENPAWYTAYTPYQPEISQGRLEALLNFQTMVAELTGLDIAGASMLDEATAAAEAMTLMVRARRGGPGTVIVVDTDVFPQTAAVLATRAAPLGIEIVRADLRGDGVPDCDPAGVILQTPGASGVLTDLRPLVDEAHERGALVAVGADLLAMTLVRPPGEDGADVCFGSTQRFGVPMGFGGPHAGYIAVGEEHVRRLPGRLVGVSHDADGTPAYRLALQTREQHIRREKATSNICSAQVLPAVLASMYACYHGAEGLIAIARRIAARAEVLSTVLGMIDVEVVHRRFFDTVLARVPGAAARVVERARDAAGLNLRLVDADHVAVSCDETTTDAQVNAVIDSFAGEEVPWYCPLSDYRVAGVPPRTTPFLQHEAFTRYRSETAMMRYLRQLADKDIALDRSMIPLGSCTMKLNAAAEMEPITWPHFAGTHPFAPQDQARGTLRVIADMERWLAAITGYAAVSVQPNAGSQGELAGLLAIAAYHRDNGQTQRTVCLIPSSAHGTNAASAVLAGLRVIVVACDEAGNIDLADLKGLLAEHDGTVAALMLTYPSTHGVYEESVGEVCAAVHDAGGQVYIDGANLNALVGLARPGRFGGDVSHVNLHKTFCIPHGGGGPGVGPIGVRDHLVRYLPGHPMAPRAPGLRGGPPVSAAPYGSASILPISWAYIRMLGADGLRQATVAAVVAANYVAARLGEHYPVLYTGAGGLVAHECVLDLRAITRETGVTVEDVAKRLADYGLHAPTMSFPVAGTLMVEPTESENLEALDEFCDAMIAIRREVDRVSSGEWPADDNPLRGAPHTAECLVHEWTHPYSRAEAVYPWGTEARRPKIWPAVRRIDSAYGDRHLTCSCPPVEDLAETR
ncbi:aminomethyl-transferring glycine dehydrogenase [Tomitella fengzijianii]|uniref:aminomethyl-transferring glycine dehydrogenase n=1 Tax=Tomitella fengzijianii TaxID=2597660 RepID=UPI00131D9DD2|nr:aminomethyl-transferring glycine dehydrogenase [Tomitella fengzijianii]